MLELFELTEDQISELDNQGILSYLKCDYFRIVSSFLNYIVYDNNELVGIINLNTESTNDFIFLDIHIFDNQQNKGYGKELTILMMNALKNRDELLFAQTTKDNKVANKVLTSLGNLVMKHKENNYYLLSDLNRLDDDKLKKLIDHRNYGKKLSEQKKLSRKKDYTIIRK